jgi:hypothetical protein
MLPRLHSGDDVQRREEPLVTTREFSRSELAAAFEKFEQTVARAAETRDWAAWVGHYTPDVEYVEHAAGTRCAPGSSAR